MRIVNQNWTKPRKGAAPTIKKFSLEDRSDNASVRPDVLGIVTLYGTFVQTGTGTHVRNSLANLVVLDATKRIIYNSTFLPIAPITDYRTAETSLTPEDFTEAKSITEIREEVQPLLVNKVLGFNTQTILNQLGVHVPSRRVLDLNHSYYGSVLYDRGLLGLDSLLRLFYGTQYSTNPTDKVKLIYILYLKRKNTWYSDLANYYKIVQKKIDPASVLDIPKGIDAEVGKYSNKQENVKKSDDECSDSDDYNYNDNESS